MAINESFARLRIQLEQERALLDQRWGQGCTRGASFAIEGEGNSKIVVFRCTPGETIHVRTPQQAQAARRRWRRLWLLGVAVWLAGIAAAVLL